jgi:hypothetical protein
MPLPDRTIDSKPLPQGHYTTARSKELMVRAALGGSLPGDQVCSTAQKALGILWEGICQTVLFVLESGPCSPK